MLCSVNCLVLLQVVVQAVFAASVYLRAGFIVGVDAPDWRNGGATDIAIFRCRSSTRFSIFESPTT